MTPSLSTCSERLVLHILPAEIVTRRKAGEATIADSVPGGSVVFFDTVDFTSLLSTDRKIL